MVLVSVVLPCYNEAQNIEELYKQTIKQFVNLSWYDYELIFIDNASTDNTVALIKEIIEKDKKVKLIVNSRNFWHIRSPYYALLQSSGDATILMATDLQEPPSLISKFIKKREEGFKIVKGVKTASKESTIMFFIRKVFYNFINNLSDVTLTKNHTGFGLYDKKIIEILRGIDEPYPYFRGLLSEIGFDFATVEYTQLARKRGITKNNFYTLYDMAMAWFTNHSKVPLRLAVFIGLIFSCTSFLIWVIYLIAKLIFWNSFQFWLAPILIGTFFFFWVQLLFLGILGEYIGAIYTQVKKRPLVIEKERINF